jgi:hypothetical protein
MICPTGKAKYFSPKGWTAFSQNSPSGKSPLATLLVEPSVTKAKGFATPALGQKADLNRRMTDARLPPTDGVIGRPSLWIAEDFGCCASG